MPRENARAYKYKKQNNRFDLRNDIHYLINKNIIGM